MFNDALALILVVLFLFCFMWRISVDVFVCSFRLFRLLCFSGGHLLEEDGRGRAKGVQILLLFLFVCFYCLLSQSLSEQMCSVSIPCIMHCFVESPENQRDE